MKKIFTLFSAALICLCVSAQDCPSTLSLSLVNGEDPSNVEIELMLYNSSSELYGFAMVFAKAEGSESVQWKKIGRKWFTAEDYFDVVLANLESATGQNINDLDYFGEYFELKAKLINDQLQLMELLGIRYGLYFPVLEEPTAIGRFCLDMSACADGVYEIVSDHNLIDIHMLYKHQDNDLYYWIIDEPMVLTLMKQGDKVSEIRSVPATYVPGLSAISTIAEDNDVDSRIFDLQGRELKSVPERGVYIQNGKKHVK